MSQGGGKQEEEKNKGVSRRRFLATSGAAVTLPLLHTTGALAGTGASDKAASVTPSVAAPAVRRTGASALHGSGQVTRLSSSLQSASTADATDEPQGSPMGRMFPTLPAYAPTDQALVDLAATIPGRPSENPDNPSMVAGVTYLGQFIDHDITFDEASNLFGTNDPNTLTNSRTARFDLDSVYGAGPDGSPELYDPADPKKLLVISSGQIHDLPRNGDGTAIIADSRNDMHKIIVQLHVAFAKFHNNAVDLLRGQNTPEELVFPTAQQTLRWHYQWIVATEFVPKIVGPEVASEILTTNELGLPQVTTQFFSPVPGNAYMPVEFSAAAFRFAHSMVRFGYRINTERVVPLFGRLLGGSPVTSGSMVMWGNFFHIPGSIVGPQLPHRIDGHMASMLEALPNSITGDGFVKNLAERNLRRAKALGLPSGQQVAAFIGAEVLTNEQLGLSNPGLQGEAPLWFYILKEAEIQKDGRSLGQVGGRIVAEVLLGMLAADPTTYLHAAPAFQPESPIAQTAGEFRMADLLLFAGVPI